MLSLATCSQAFRTAVLALAAMPAAAPPLGAQGPVRGRIAILEKGGKPTADLQNAVVWLEPAGGAARAAPGRVQVAMESKRFVPRVRVVTVGSTVDFPNADPFRHNVFSNTGPSTFDVGLYERGQTRGARFDRAGVHPIFCNIHAQMVAYVIAVATPYFAQAEPDGRFAIADVPAGRYTLRAWHERGGAQAREVEVGASALDGIEVALDARRYRFVQHKNKHGQDYESGPDRY